MASQEKRYNKIINSSLKQGLIMFLLSVSFIPGIAFKLLGAVVPVKDNALIKFFAFSYDISPNISSFRQMLGASGSELLTFSNISSVILILLFTMGCTFISLSFKTSDEKSRLDKEAREEKYKEEVKAKY